MTELRIDSAHLFGAFLGLTLWGLYIILFIITIKAVCSAGYQKLRSPAILAILLLFALNVASTVVIVRELHTAFITSPVGAEEFFTGNMHDGFQNSSNFIFIIATIIQDLVLLWRLYIIWSRTKRILIIPGLFIATLLAGCAVVGTYSVLVYVHGYTEKYWIPLQSWTWAMLALTISFSWLVTGLIVGRLWYSNKDLRAKSVLGPFQKYDRLIDAIVESGVLYSIALGAFLIAWMCGNGRVAYLLLPSMPRVVGIVPTLTIFRLTGGHTQPADNLDFLIVTLPGEKDDISTEA